MNRWISVAFLTGLATITLAAADQTLTLGERVKQATAILSSQNESGGQDVRCTATAFKKDGSTYSFVSTAHCVGSDDVTHEKVAAWENQSFWITFDEPDVKRYFAAIPTMVGYQHRGDDFSVFIVDASRHKGDEEVKWPVVGLGNEKDEVEGADVINVAAPQGLGIQVFKGAISSLYLDRPVVQGDINWKGVMMLQMPGTNGGSSGSAIVSVKQEKIVGFLVGTIGETTVTAVPVSRFKAFMDSVKDGKYHWMRSGE